VPGARPRLMPPAESEGELPDMAPWALLSDQAALMLQHQFTSTLRETLNAQFCIVSPCDVLGEALRGKCIVYMRANRGSIDALSRLDHSKDGCIARLV